MILFSACGTYYFTVMVLFLSPTIVLTHRHTVTNSLQHIPGAYHATAASHTRILNLLTCNSRHTLTIINHLYIHAQTGYTMYNVFTTPIIFNWSFGVNIQHLSYALYETHLVVILAQVQNGSCRRCSLFPAA